MIGRAGRAAAVAALALAGGVLLLRLLPGPGDIALAPGTRPDHPIRIVALGTSLTARALWPARVEAALAPCAPGLRVERLARPGARSDWGLAEAGRVRAAAPDLVIVEMAMNDADLHDGLWPWQSRAAHRALLARLMEGDGAPRVLLLTVNPVRGAAVILRPLLPLYQRAYGDLARQSGAGLVDGMSLWQRRGADRRAVPDGVHPDPEVEADLLAPALAAAVARGLGLDCPVP